MKRSYVSLGLVLTINITLLNAQNTGNKDRFRILFYNVENYFDTANDPSINDDEFTPEGFKHWDFYKYRTKQTRIAKTIIASGQWQIPELVGLAEIENLQVLKELVRFSPLKKFNYHIIHKESPDWRGIDVALLYQPKAFKPLDTQFLEVDFPDKPDRTTRDILYTKGIAAKKDTLHIFINHWPSRYGGKARSDPKRKRAALILRQKVDSIFSKNSQARIIITGDFNDDPINASISQVLNAGPDTSSKLINLMHAVFQSNQTGSYKYQYHWHTFDQFIVSRSLIRCSKGLCSGMGNAHVFQADFLMVADKKYPGKKLHRTYLGPRYKDGYSDHLPIYLDLFPTTFLSGKAD